jgi:hypothetical protein
MRMRRCYPMRDEMRSDPPHHVLVMVRQDYPARGPMEFSSLTQHGLSAEMSLSRSGVVKVFACQYGASAQRTGRTVSTKMVRVYSQRVFCAARKALKDLERGFMAVMLYPSQSSDEILVYVIIRECFIREVSDHSTPSSVVASYQRATVASTGEPAASPRSNPSNLHDLR